MAKKNMYREAQAYSIASLNYMNQVAQEEEEQKVVQQYIHKTSPLNVALQQEQVSELGSGYNY